MTDMIQQSEDASIQARATSEGDGVGLAFLGWMAKAGDLIAPWWSKARDANLNAFWPTSDHLSGALFSLAARMTAIPVHVEPRDPSVKLHMKQADEYTARLVEGSEYGAGWGVLFQKYLLDLWTQDNGAFMEVIGEGNPAGPIEGPALGLAHLDSFRCTRSGSPAYPVTYEDTDGKRYKLHYTRVVAVADMASARVDMHGVGFCAASRCINTAQSLVDDLKFKGEKLGSRPLRAIGLARRLPKGTMENALALANSSMDNRGLTRYAMIPFIENAPADAQIDLISLANLPDGFDYQTDVTLTMFTIALALGIPPRWIWPATQSGATKADAMYSHIAGLSQGPAQVLASTQAALGGSPDTARSYTAKFLPPHLKLVFDYIDDEQDRQNAEISGLRADRRTKDLASGVTDLRTERERALSAGELTPAQFEDLEAADGRTPDGANVLTLFYSPDYADMLRLGVTDPLDISANDAAAISLAIAEKQRAAMHLLATGQPGDRRRAQFALAALNTLADKYSPQVATAAPDTSLPPAVPTARAEADGVDEPTLDDQGEPDGGSEGADPFSDMKMKAQVLAMVYKFSVGAGPGEIQSEYRDTLYAAMADYLESNSPITKFRNAFRRAVNDAFTLAFIAGYADAGGATEEMPREDMDWLQSKINTEIGYADGLFNDLRDIRATKTMDEVLGYAEARADGYAAALGGIYSDGKLRGAKNKMLTFDGDDGAESCSTCQSLKGKRHSARWWLERGLNPRIKGNPNFECNTYNCEHYLIDDEGNIFTEES